MNRERKILVAILVLGLLALVVDQLFLSTGEPASADAAVTVPPSAIGMSAITAPPTIGDIAAADAPSSSVESPDAPALAQVPPSVAGRLRKAEQGMAIDPQDVADAFEPPASWLPQPDAADGQAAQPLSAQGRAFAQRHQLEAVMLQGERSFILVDGKPLRSGDVLDGWTLVQIDARSAVFEAGDVRAVLRLTQTQVP